MKIKSLLLLLGALFVSSTFFVACSDDDDDLPNYRAGNYHYDVIVLNDDYSMEMDLDSVASEVTEIEHLPDWISLKQLKFDKDGHPIMKIDVQSDPRGKARDADVKLKTKGGDIVKLSFSQSARYSSLGFQGNGTFDVTNWYNATEINIYDKNLDKMVPVNLPWADPAETSIPDEFRMITKNHDKWTLCFNTCSNSNLRNTQMFGMFNKETQTLRVFKYFDNPPTDATTCYFVVSTSSSSSILNSDNLQWGIPIDKAKSTLSIPTDSLVKNMPKFKSAIVVPPLCGNDQGTISAGWCAFDVPFTTAFKDKDDILKLADTNIGLHMLACEITNTTGNIDFSQLHMIDKDIQIKSPASDAKIAAASLSVVGNLLTGLCSTAGSAVGAGAASGGFGIATGIVGCIGNVVNVGTDIANAVAASEDEVYTMSLDFHFEGETKLNTQSITYKGNGFADLTISIGSLFEYLLDSKAPARRAPQKENSKKIYNFGIWNLAQTPTIYVSKDALFYNESTYGTDYNSDGQTISSFGSDENLRYASFLDPSSIQVYINDDTDIFPHDKVKNLEVTGYSFVYSNNPFTRPDIFYNYYGVNNDQICLTTEDDSWNYIFTDNDSKSMRLIEYDDKDLLLDKDAGADNMKYKTVGYFGKDVELTGYTFKYAGCTTDLTGELSGYDAVYDPIVYVPRNSNGLYPVKSNFANLGVVVLIKFEIGDETYVYSRRYLPEIKTFGKTDVASIRNRINGFNKKTYDGLDANYILFDKEKAKALKILSLVE